MPTVFITGANRGIGLEFTRQYAAASYTVIATCRNPLGVGELATVPGDIQVHGLEVTSGAQLARLADDLSEVPFDILINNAGIYGPRSYDPAEADVAEWLKVMEVNVMTPLAVSAAFVRNVAAGHGKIATLSSKMGSMSDNTSGGSYIYRSSKAAVNAVMKSLSIELQGKSIPVCMLHPGWVQTDMGGENALITTEESVSGMRQVIDDLSMTTTGHFFNYDGTEIPW
jgi:NAD(P)-dependent dehydrogenase (short-subunit alcohol dehydrogenase family)